MDKKKIRIKSKNKNLQTNFYKNKISYVKKNSKKNWLLNIKNERLEPKKLV